MHKLLIFDLDGTLFDTAPGIHIAANEMFSQRGLPTVDYKTMTGFIGQGLAGILKQMEGDVFKEHDLPELINDFRSIYKEVYLENSFIYPHLIQFLKQWPHQLAIASNKSEYFVKELVKKSELNQFDWVATYGGDSLEECKPHPMQLDKILKSTDFTPEQAVMIGDSTDDVLAAKALSMDMVAVDFGYSPIEQLMEAGATRNISCYSELDNTLGELKSS